MLKQITTAVLMLLVLTLLSGVLYPLLLTGLAQGLFPHQASGSLIEREGTAIGSELIGQPFSDPRYFWGRPSATDPMPYHAGASSGANLGPTNPVLEAAIAARIAALEAADPADAGPIPVDLVTASASGLDPHISPAAAQYQAARVARVRGLDAAAVRDLVARHTEGRQLGVLGEPRINVLVLNLALDDLSKR